MRRNHCVADSDSGHKPRIILGLPWSQSDSNNSPTFVRLVNNNPINSGSLSATRKGGVVKLKANWLLWERGEVQL